MNSGSDGKLAENAQREPAAGAARLTVVLSCVLQIWEGEGPYNLNGNFFEVSTAETMIPEIGQGTVIKPYQYPHPPIVGTVVAPFSKGVTAMAARGWEPISANFLLPKWVKTHWPKYVEGCELGGSPADFRNWSVAKNICVADDEAFARNVSAFLGL